MCKGEFEGNSRLAPMRNDCHGLLVRPPSLHSRPEPSQGLTLNESQSPYKADVWRKLTPRERLRRSWALRSRLPNLRAVHDRKLFPKP